ncbi:hypothetical protein PISS_a2477 [Pseudoalteromonas issachenkonii]|uniref:Uncharacterized protein n=1 Tax=Pseudoalteromonas issachenkonii TaxID=152297 RepID=A0ABN5C2G5_9GAMM|nr:hypothetical protein PISS_a2477 [Pseudoalteromonas issachenkonii]
MLVFINANQFNWLAFFYWLTFRKDHSSRLITDYLPLAIII